MLVSTRGAQSVGTISKLGSGTELLSASLQMPVRLERVVCVAHRGCLSKEVKKRRWKIVHAFPQMLASGDAHNCKHLSRVLVPNTRQG